MTRVRDIEHASAHEEADRPARLRQIIIDHEEMLATHERLTMRFRTAGLDNDADEHKQMAAVHRRVVAYHEAELRKELAR